MSESYVVMEKRGEVGILTLNRPERRNVLSKQMLLELREKFSSLSEDEEIQAIILAAQGPVFSSGHDLKELVELKRDDVGELFNLCTEVMESIRKSSKPVIAKVQGLASAAGCQLVASCDLVVASQNASFQTPGVKIGLFCSTPAVPLSRVIPPKKAMEMLLTGEAISANEAARIGLVNKVVSAASLAEETDALARKITSYSGETTGIGKETFYKQLPLNHEDAYQLAKETMVRNSFTEDAREGMTAFLQKRQPHWKK